MNKHLIIAFLLFLSTEGFTQNSISGHTPGSVIQSPNQGFTALVCDTSFSFPTVDDWSGGLTFDGTYFYSTGHDSTIVYKYDVSGQYSGQFILPSLSGSSAGDLSFDGTNLWALVEQDDMLYKVDQNSGSILASFQLPTGVSSDYYGCAYDNGSIWISHYASELLLELDAATGLVINTFNINRWVLPLTIINGELYGIDFINNSASGPMQLVKFDKSTGSVIDSADWCLDYPLGITVANGNIWGLSSGIGLGTARIYGFESLPLSLNQISNNNIQVEISPNPVHNILTVKAKDSFELVISDVAGAVILTSSTTENSIDINISHLPNGVYILKTKSHNEFGVTKFVKQ